MSKLTLTHGSLSIAFSITLDYKEVGDKVAAEFAQTLTVIDKQLSDMELLAMFIEYTSRTQTYLAAAALGDFERRFCDSGSTNVHAAVLRHNLLDEQVHAVLRGYYSAWPQNTDSMPCNSAFFSSEAIRPIMTFAGSVGSLESGVKSLAELRRLVDIYKPLVVDFVCQMSDFLHGESRDLRITHCYPHGFVIAQWTGVASAQSGIDHNAIRDEYVNSSPVAAPLGGLLQLVRLIVLHKTLNVPVEQVVKRLSAVAGHSHGIAIAAAASMAGSEEQLLASSRTALGTLMLAGCLPQIVCPQDPAKANVATNDSGSDTVFETASAIISVCGAPKHAVDGVLGMFNKFHKADNSAQMYVSMANGGDWFCVSGDRVWMTQLVKNIRAKSASDADGDQEG
ncbi:hypothetical protein GGI07_004244, partial [Coemansia sp. Benny D115]